MHISIWRLIGPNPSRVCAVAGTWLLLHRASPSFLLFQQLSCSLKPPASCLGDVITFKYLETWVACQEGSAGRADAEGKRTITPFTVESWLGWKEGNLDQTRVGTEVYRGSVIALPRLWSICKAFLSNDLRTVCDFLKCLNNGSPDYKFSTLPLLTAAQFLVDRDSLGTLSIFFFNQETPPR